MWFDVQAALTEIEGYETPFSEPTPRATMATMATTATMATQATKTPLASHMSHMSHAPQDLGSTNSAP